jgi:hypothetical protein
MFQLEMKVSGSIMSAVTGAKSRADKADKAAAKKDAKPE